MTEPMTAAEYRVNCAGLFTAQWHRILAALEEREALLGERDRLGGEAENFRELARIRLKRVEQLDADVAQLKVEVADWKELHGQAASRAEIQKSDAAVGALVRRIGEHPMAKTVGKLTITVNGTGTGMGEVMVRDTLTHLDSLLPKEPEVPEVVGSSGRSYRLKDGGVETRWSDGTSDYWMKLAPWSTVVAQDAPVVAKLMAGGGKCLT